MVHDYELLYLLFTRYGLTGGKECVGLYLLHNGQAEISGWLMHGPVLVTHADINSTIRCPQYTYR